MGTWDILLTPSLPRPRRVAQPEIRESHSPTCWKALSNPVWALSPKSFWSALETTKHDTHGVTRTFFLGWVSKDTGSGSSLNTWLDLHSAPCRCWAVRAQREHTGSLSTAGVSACRTKPSGLPEVTAVHHKSALIQVMAGGGAVDWPRLLTPGTRDTNMRGPELWMAALL